MTKIDKVFRLNPRPEYCPGAYVLHLYCKYENPDHRFNEFPHESDQVYSQGEAHRQARDAGWILHRDGTGTCPKCAARLKAGEKPLPAPPEKPHDE